MKILTAIRAFAQTVSDDQDAFTSAALLRGTLDLSRVERQPPRITQPSGAGTPFVAPSIISRDVRVVIEFAVPRCDGEYRGHDTTRTVTCGIPWPSGRGDPAASPSDD